MIFTTINNYTQILSFVKLFCLRNIKNSKYFEEICFDNHYKTLINMPPTAPAMTIIHGGSFQ